MKFQMPRNSVFAMLLRSAWWVSALIAVVLLAASQLVTAPFLAAFLLFASFPFAVIAAVAGWKQRNRPSAQRVERTANAVRAMSWAEFSGVLQEGLRRDGCETVACKSEHADFEARRQGRIALVSARRWKASRVGVQALSRLEAQRQARGAHEAIYVTVGDISEQAAAYAQANHIKFMTAPELARLLPR
ncbi:restriction endonuclease [Verticiella sediminum]|uniref:Restriction endonuclease n=1 Tax=Verticiella sediminum TaxID=1247510 RepID=A0A556A9J7_9BURK|nr:restriction endonuclease [Verticiella sediminum]TSH89555.1 restriction endonuclease [Verticiella sediminum]